MGHEVRAIDGAEAEAWLRQLSHAFFMQPTDGPPEYFLAHADLSRCFGAFDGTAVVGTLRSFANELTVPGRAAVPVSALTMVSVASTHRRHGILTEMITTDLRDSASRGEVASILLASEYPIYSRFGYGPATQRARFDIATVGLRFLPESSGSVEIIDLSAMRTLAPPLFERFRASQHGAIGRSEAWWDRMTGVTTSPGSEPFKGTQAVYRAPSGELEGYVTYDGKMQWEQFPLSATMTVHELVATTPDAYLGLWEYCCSVDLQNAVVAPTRVPDEVLGLLVADARRVKLAEVSDFLWVRLLDTPSALSARTYEGAGRLVVEVVDDLGFAGGRFALEGDESGATCSPTTQSAELTISVADLGAAYLGLGTWTRLAAAGRVDEHVHGAVARAEAMFRTAREPWCTTFF